MTWAAALQGDSWQWSRWQVAQAAVGLRAGVIKALNQPPGNKHRNFIETHIAKSQRQRWQAHPSHILTTSYLTMPHRGGISAATAGYRGPLHLSQGRSVGLRMT